VEVKEPFCPIPFLSLSLSPEGEAYPCCFLYGDERIDSLGNVLREGLSSVWNGPKIQQLREEFLNGSPKICAKNIQRTGCNKFYPELESHVVFSKVQSSWPRRLDLRINGQCNLQCKMCETWKESSGLYNQSDLWEKGPTEIFPHLVEVELLGGEPFVQRDTYRLIEEISKVNSECYWRFVTNAHWTFTEKIKKQLENINIRYVQLSVDSLDRETYSRIRTLGRLEVVEKCMERWIEFREDQRSIGKDFLLSLACVVQKDNFGEVEKFLEFSLQRDLHMVFIFCRNPKDLSLLSLPVHAQLKILEDWKALANRKVFGRSVRPYIQRLIKSLSSNLDALNGTPE